MFLTAAALLAASFNCPAADAPTAAKQAGKSPVKVFVLAGQSNMEGPAVVDIGGKDCNDRHGNLETLMKDPAKAPMLKHLRGADGKWTVRDDVWVRYQGENAPLLAGPHGLGYSARTRRIQPTGTTNLAMRKRLSWLATPWEKGWRAC